MVVNASFWYAIKTLPRWEKKVVRLLSEKGIENYCPLNKVLRQWSDRKKIVMEPIFKSYVFVKIDEVRKWDIRNISGILNYVYWLGKPAKIREEEIDIIRKFLGEFEHVAVEKKSMTLDSKVRVKQGMLMNYEGILIEVKGNRAIVRIDSLDIQLSAQFEKGNLELVT